MKRINGEMFGRLSGVFLTVLISVLFYSVAGSCQNSDGLPDDSLDKIDSGDDFSLDVPPDDGGAPKKTAKTSGSKANQKNSPANSDQNSGDGSQGGTASNSDASNNSSSGKSGSSGANARVTGLDFDSNQNGGTVIIKTNQPISYMTRKNPDNNQFIIDLAGTTLPAQFKRPYDTKEFSGPIGLISAYQKKGSNTSRVVLQLQTAADFSVRQEGNKLYIAPSSGSAGGSSASKSSKKSGEEDSGAENNNAANDQDQNQAGNTDQPRASSGTESPASPGSGTSGKYYGHPINLQVKDADVREILSFIAEESGMNLVISDEVKGTISLKLRKIPWDQALLVILSAKQLGYVRQDRILRIAPLGKLKEEALATKDAIDSQKAVANLRQRIFKINYAEASKLKESVSSFLTPQRGKVITDERTNQLILIDLDEVLDKVGELISRLDRPTQQVLIEGRIVEVTESIQEQMGFNYSSVGSNINFGVVTVPGPNHIGISFDGTDFGISMGFLEAESRIKVLASPKIITLNNVEGKISQTSEYPTYPSSVIPNAGSTATTGGTAAPVVSQTVTMNSVKDVDLTVTPQISNDRSITMKIAVKREFAGSVDPASGSTAARPKFQREASAKVMVRDGQTAVLGGVFLDSLTDSVNRIPLLGRIPFIGALFRSSAMDDEKNELVIFLTPKIVELDDIGQNTTGPKSNF